MTESFQEHDIRDMRSLRRVIRRAPQILPRPLPPMPSDSAACGPDRANRRVAFGRMVANIWAAALNVDEEGSRSGGETPAGRPADLHLRMRTPSQSPSSSPAEGNSAESREGTRGTRAPIAQARASYWVRALETGTNLWCARQRVAE